MRSRSRRSPHNSPNARILNASAIGDNQRVASMLERLKQIVRRERKSTGGRERSRRRRDSDFERMRGREIAQASPERAGELAGHPVERVDT
jgi:hypothetical protein